MRLSLIFGTCCLLLTACHTTISADSQELARLQQDKARLNRVYAHAEMALLEVQRSEAAVQAARIKLSQLSQARLQACPELSSPNVALRLRYSQCHYAATAADLQQLQTWRRSQQQFPLR